MELNYILLFGMARSGTTWIGKVFDSHPETLYRHEPDSYGGLAAVPLIVPTAEVGRHEQAVKSFVARLHCTGSLRVAGKLPLFPKAYYSPSRFAMRRSLVMLGKLASRLLGDVSVPNLIDFHHAGELHVVWKSIESLGRLGVVARTVPDSRAIHVIRHPCGYVASIRRGEATGNLSASVPASEDYGMLELLMDSEPARRRGLDMEHMRSASPVERLAWRWVLFNEKAMDDMADVEGYRIVRYEDLCADPVEGFKSLFAFAGLPWAAQSEQFVTQSSSTDRTSYYSVYRNAQKAASAWKHELDGADVERVLSIAGDSVPGKIYLSGQQIQDRAAFGRHEDAAHS